VHCGIVTSGCILLILGGDLGIITCIQQIHILCVSVGLKRSYFEFALMQFKGIVHPKMNIISLYTNLFKLVRVKIMVLNIACTFIVFFMFACTNI